MSIKTAFFLALGAINCAIYPLGIYAAWVHAADADHFFSMAFLLSVAVVTVAGVVNAAIDELCN